MPRLARAQVFEPAEFAILHIFDRVVRSCFLFGNDHPGLSCPNTQFLDRMTISGNILICQMICSVCGPS